MEEKKYTTVEVEKDTHKILKKESDKTGIKIRKLVDKAIKETYNKE